MIRLHNLKLSLDYSPAEMKSAAAKALGIPKGQVQGVRLYRKSVDARRKNAVCFVVSLDVSLKDPAQERRIAARLRPQDGALVSPEKPHSMPALRPRGPRPAVIGFGPAGIFAALTLAEAGLCPLVLERGRSVEMRTQDVHRYFSEGAPGFSPVSNVQFGEGGAGTFSDGKLNSGIKDGLSRQVLEIFVRFGAPEEILIDQKPHIGTDRLAGVVRTMRDHILALGGEVLFEAKAVSLGAAGGRLASVSYEKDGKTFEVPCERAVLGIGHSARDTFEMLLHAGHTLVPKPFSMGVRIEHTQELINRAQYGPFANHPALGAADYKLAVHLPSGRGVYTFCMCPGGTVVAAASEMDTVVTNGMSVYARDGRNANSALLVGIEPSDFPGSDPLAGMYWQREFEQKAFVLGGGSGRAPCQSVGDFLGKSADGPAVHPSYLPGVTMTDLRRLYPPLFTDAIAEALPMMGRRLQGFDLPAALLTGPETRSSSPVRIPRGENLESLSLPGLYPCGEGAGYAGGITSAAADGIRCAEAILAGYEV